MTLIATPKAIDANSFATLLQANAYHDTRLHNSEWTSASDSDKQKALISATRLLNPLSFAGHRTNDDQALSWPRYSVHEDCILLDDDTIPKTIINAVSEFAWLLLIKDSTRESGDKGFKSIKVGPINLDMDAADRKGAIPRSVMDIIAPLIGSKYTVGVMRG